MESNLKTLYMVLPCYNEEECIKESNLILNKKLEELIRLEKISSSSKIVYVNDGSKDRTLEIIKEEALKNDRVKYISLSKNFGQQKAILCGLEISAKYADIMITMDVDLQDDIDVIDSFIDAHNNGNDIVFGVRNSRQADTWFKRTSALLYYKIMEKLGANIVYNHAEFRLMSKKAVMSLIDYKESNIFLRGMVKDLGFKTTIVKYDRKKRNEGKSKYSLGKMLELAKEGVISFSSSPLKLITKFGFVISILSVIYCIYATVRLHKRE